MAAYYLDDSGLKKIMDLMERQFGSNCEVVLHDLSRTYDSTIVDIRNGHITGRHIGDPGSNLGLEVIRGTVQDGDKFNYFTSTKDGKILRSSSIYLHGENGQVRYSLCVNVDITDSVKFENYLHNQNRYELSAASSDEGKEIFVNNVHDLLEELLQQGIRFVGKQPQDMNRDEKAKLVDYLDKKGAFLISKSGEKICEALNISKYTFYSLLDAARNNDKDA